MKKSLITASLIVAILALLSWGVTGHRTIGKIAENHLTIRARTAIKDLLQNESLTDVSTFADDVRAQDEFKYTAPWHYINLPLGLNYSRFENEVVNMQADNVYKALLKCKSDIINPSATRKQKIFALKFIVHLVGDLHQPMHVSRAEDRGGNSIQVSFEGKAGNLHGLWDSDLLEHKGLNYQELADVTDHPSEAQVNAWQQDGIISWMFESYQVSSELYTDAANNPSFNEAYYQTHFPVIQERLLKAGVRLAGLLNQLFEDDGYKISAAEDITYNPGYTSVARIQSKDARSHVGETVTLSAKIYSSHLVSSNDMLLLNAGAEFPNQDVTIMIRKVNIAKFPENYLENLPGKNILVTGKIINYNGKPEIEVIDPSQVSLTQ